MLAALAAAEACGVTRQEAVQRIERVPPFMGRMQPVAMPGGAIMMRDEETGTPDTLAAMMAVLTDARAERRGLVFSDVSDTRQKPRKRLAEIGRAAAAHCDFAVFVGSHAHHAVKAATGAGMDPAACREFIDLRDAAAWLKSHLRRGDLVFLKGRTTDHLSRILFAQLGTIDCWKYSCSVRRMCDTCTRLRADFDVHSAVNGPLPARLSIVRVDGGNRVAEGMSS